MLPITPTVKLIDISNGKIMNLPKISQANKNIGTNKAVWYKVFFKISPLYKLIILGIISPKNGIFPTVIIVTAQINETIANPTLTTKL